MWWFRLYLNFLSAAWYISGLGHLRRVSIFWIAFGFESDGLRWPADDPVMAVHLRVALPPTCQCKKRRKTLNLIYIYFGLKKATLANYGNFLFKKNTQCRHRLRSSPRPRPCRWRWTYGGGQTPTSGSGDGRGLSRATGGAAASICDTSIA
jgi:hypothetical protein